MGDVLGGCWNVFLCARNPMKLTIVPNLVDGGTCLAERYEFIGRPAAGDPPGRRINYAIPYSAGVVREVVVMDKSREMRILSRHIQLEAQSLEDIWHREMHLPPFAATHSRPSLSDQIAIFGGWRRWGNLHELDKGVKDDLRRATPRGVWELALSELFRGMTCQIPEAPNATSSPLRATDTGGGVDGWMPILGERRGKMAVPDLCGYYDDEYCDSSRYRTWGERLAPPVTLPMSTSFQDSWAQTAEERCVEKKMEVWKISSDSKKTLANDKIAGNRPLPATHWDYHIMWRQIM